MARSSVCYIPAPISSLSLLACPACNQPGGNLVCWVSAIKKYENGENENEMKWRRNEINQLKTKMSAGSENGKMKMKA
jgi:uncharacterized protein YbaR (Trm112 family)